MIKSHTLVYKMQYVKKNRVSHGPKGVQCERTSEKKEMQKHRMTTKICKSGVKKKIKFEMCIDVREQGDKMNDIEQEK